ncbi:MAG: ssl1498 family light-harvesting-like protein [Cyanobacteria bacterium P01_A01_bin.123]
MYTKQLDNGVLNNYAMEPAISLASYPSREQQRRYALQGACAALLVTVLFVISFAVS